LNGPTTRIDRSGVLVLRVWTADGSSLSARLTHTLDIAAGQEETTVEGTVDGVCEAVRRWLEKFVEANR
jgi:hypothetical protein